MTRHWLKPEHSDEWAKQGERVLAHALQVARARVLARVDRDARALRLRRDPLPGADIASYARSIGNGRRGPLDLDGHR